MEVLRRARARRGLYLLLLVGWLLCGCAKEEKAAAPTDEQPPSTAPGASHLLAQVGSRLTVSGPEAECLERRVEADVALRERTAKQVPAPGSAEFDQLEDYVVACTNEVTFAAAFVEMERRKHGELLPDEQECLRESFAALTADELEQVLSSGVEEPPDAVLGIEENCGLSPESKEEYQ